MASLTIINVLHHRKSYPESFDWAYPADEGGYHRSSAEV